MSYNRTVELKYSNDINIRFRTNHYGEEVLCLTSLRETEIELTRSEAKYLGSIIAYLADLLPVEARTPSKPDRRKNSRRTVERKVPTMGGLASSDRRQAARRQNDRTKKRLKEQYPAKK